MAKNKRNPSPTAFDPNAGYPQQHTCDGIDTSKPRTGAMKNALMVSKPVKFWTNSKTNEPMDPPEYAREDD